MIKLLVLERNVMICSLPILLLLTLTGSGAYFFMIMQEPGSDLQFVSAIASAVSMSVLTGFALALLTIQQGLKRLRLGI